MSSSVVVVSSIRDELPINHDLFDPYRKSFKLYHGADTNMSEISYGEFKRIDMRVGTVLTAEKVAGSDKLMKMKVDFGGQVKQAVAGLAHLYEAEHFVGKQYVFVFNLKPAMFRGQMSECMILAAAKDDSVVIAVTPERSVENGLRVL